MVRSPEIDPSPWSVTDCPDVALDLTFSLSEVWSKATVLRLSLTMSPFPSPAREVVTSVPSGGILRNLCWKKSLYGLKQSWKSLACLSSRKSGVDQVKNGEDRVWGGPGVAERKPMFVESVLRGESRSGASKQQGLDERGSCTELGGGWSFPSLNPLSPFQ